MSKKKYEKYEVATDMGEHTIYDYHEALSVFRRYDGSATLYGINEMGDYSVIFSKQEK